MSPKIVNTLLGLCVGLACMATHAVAQVMISEMMVHPLEINGVEPVDQEYIELLNAGSAAVTLTDWRFDRGVDYVFPEMVVAAGGRVVVAADLAGFRASHADFVGDLLGGWLGKLSNSGERVRLVNAAGETVDEVRYADEGDWAVRRLGPSGGWEWVAPFDGGGASLEVVDIARSNDVGQNWLSSTTIGGTPGRANSVASMNSAPFIGDVSHYPPVPSPSDEVLVRARIDSQRIPEVTLHYRVSSTEPGPFLSLLMRDDGESSDGLAGDAVYGARLPAQPEETVVEFYLSARLSDGVERTWPTPSNAAGDHVANALYQVEALAAEQNDQPFYRLILSVSEALRFRPETFNSSSNAQMNATFIASRDGNTTLRYLAGVRRRGNGSRSRDPRSHRLSLPGDRPWDGLTQLNLLSQYSYLQALGMHLCKSAGLPAPRGRLIQLRINGFNYANTNNRFGVHYGSYVHMDPLGSEFIDRQFPDDSGGNLYKKVSADPSRDQKRWGVHFEQTFVYRTDPNWYRTDRWTKETNVSIDDWSDLQAFIVAMNEAPDNVYVEEISRHINLDQWLRWFALLTLINDSETNLSNGIDDDYSMYRGEKDTRFVLLPHDLDTIFGLGDTASNPNATIFQAIDRNFGAGDARIPQLERFFNHPQIRLAYFRQLSELLDGVLSPGQLDPLVEHLLGDYVPSDVRGTIKQFMRDRRDYVLGIIDRPLSASLELGRENDLWVTDGSEATISGRASSLHAARVRIDGKDVIYDRNTGTWNHLLLLTNGLNQVTIESLNDEGRVLDTLVLPILRKASVGLELSGELVGDHVLASSDGPVLLKGMVIVPVGASLTIQAGTTVYVDGGSRLEVPGRLQVLGEADGLVSFAKWPDSALSLPWNGVLLRGPTGHVLKHVVMSGVSNDGGVLRLEDTFAVLESVDFQASANAYIVGERSSVTLHGCHFAAHGEAAAGDGDHVRLLEGFYGGQDSLIHGCVFEPQNDGRKAVVIEGDVQSRAMLQVLENTFYEAAVGIQGDAWLMGNRFSNVDGVAIELSERQNDTVAVIANRFESVGVAVDVTKGWGVVFENNLVDGAEISVLRANGGEGNALRRNVLLNVVSAPDSGEENFWMPVVRELPGGKTSLLEAFAERGLGPLVRQPVRLRAAPGVLTPSSEAHFEFAGPGVNGLQYRLDGGDWSGLIPANTDGRLVVSLSALVEGPHSLDVRVQWWNGLSQAPEEAATFSWIVDPSESALVLNEVLAGNRSVLTDSASPGYVELYNRSDRSVSLEGYELRKESDPLRKFVFSAGKTLAPGGFIVLRGGSPEGPAESDRLGFSLDSLGEAISLVAPNGALLEVVDFGTQSRDLAIGHLPEAPKEWGFVMPSPGEANVSIPLAPPQFVRLNEWVASSGLLGDADFLELYNSAPWPADLRTVHLTDDRRNAPEKRALGGLNALPGEGYLVFSSNENLFQLDADFEELALVDAKYGLIDAVFLQGQSPEFSEGRLPDGADFIGLLAKPTLGAANPDPPKGKDDEVVVALIDWESQWAYDDSGVVPLDGWNQLGFDDGTWFRGVGALARETATLAVAKNTNLRLNPPTTHYFRQEFNVPDPAAFDSYRLETLVDDGAVFYLNGIEMVRLRLPAGQPIDGNTFATTGVGNAIVEGPFEIDPETILPGTNVLAVSVHQDDGSSSDVVFAARLLGIPRDESPSGADMGELLLGGLRITEIMYAPTDLGGEWLEFTNVSDEPLVLEGVQLTEGVQFVFPNETLAPGARVLVVEDMNAFRSVHGDGPAVAGVFSGKLDNNGERLTLTLPPPWSTNILSFDYDDRWFPASDGLGGALVIQDVRRERATWSDSGAWTVAGGTPGYPPAPRFYSAGSASGIMGDAFQFAFLATPEPSAYAAIGLPPGLVLEAPTGIVSGVLGAAGDFDVIVSAANAGGVSTASFRLEIAASGPRTNFFWEPILSSPKVGDAVEATVTARDAEGRVVVTDNEVLLLDALATVPGEAPLLITEVFDRSPDGLEMQNVTSKTVITQGWKLWLNRATDGDPREVHGLDGVEGEMWSFPNQLGPGEVIYLQDNANLPGYIGFNVRWDHNEPGGNRLGGQRGWAAIIDADGEVVDAVFWGYPSEAVERLVVGSVVFRDVWQGEPVAHQGADSVSLSRAGKVDSGGREGWIWADESPGFQNPGLAYPLGSTRSVQVQPNTVTLENGLWRGSLRFDDSGESSFLVARSADDLTSGVLGPFVILPAGPPVWSEAALSITVVQNQPFSQRVSVDNRPSEFAVEGFPFGLSVDARTGLIGGRIGQVGGFEGSLSAINALGASEVPLEIRVLGDSDGDGMDDGWETIHGFDPKNEKDAMVDADGDARSNIAEYIAGTDPGDARSYFEIQSLNWLADRREIQLAWSSVPGRRYQVWLGSVVSGELLWEPQPGTEIQAGGATATAVIGLDGDGRLVRVETYWRAD